MKIALITDSVETGSPGFRSYVMGLAEALLSHSGPHEYTLVHRRPDPFYQDRPELRLPDVRGWLIRKQLLLPRELRRHGFHLVHDTYHFGPFLLPAPYARVMTIGDLTPLLLPTHPLKARLAHRLLLPLLARRAHHIVTFSQSSKRDIVRLLRVPAERVTVAYLAAAPAFRPINDPCALNALRQRYRLPPRFFLHVGTLEPRKNLGRLVEAYGRALPQLGDSHLVLAGKPGWGTEALPALIRRLGLEERVVSIGAVNNADLPLLYNAALALVYPSLYEGFGLPPLEAMQCGLPVITSNVSSLPEVVGNAAILIDPTSVDMLASSLVTIAQQEHLRKQLSGKGVRRAQQFTWQRCAEGTIAAYERAWAAVRRERKLLEPVL